MSSDGAQRLLFIDVPDAKEVTNRVHLNLKPTRGTRDKELKPLLGLGAREVADRRRADGSGWVVLADPESNEFCILRGDAERAASRGPQTNDPRDCAHHAEERSAGMPGARYEPERSPQDDPVLAVHGHGVL